jgi:hypothetical protein
VWARDFPKRPRDISVLYFILAAGDLSVDFGLQYYDTTELGPGISRGIMAFARILLHRLGSEENFCLWISMF